MPGAILMVNKHAKVSDYKEVVNDVVWWSPIFVMSTPD